MTAEYDPSQVQHLDALKAIRLRPTMYIGDPSNPAALSSLLIEAACLAFDNVATGCATEVHVSLGIDGSATIRDDGPGLSVKPLNHGMSAVEMVFTQMFACREAKKSKLHGDTLCRVGIVATTALSEWLTYETIQDGHLWRQRYEQGRAVGEIEEQGPASGSYQQVMFKPDSEIFGSSELSADRFIQWVQELNIPLNGATVTLIHSDGSSVRLRPADE